MLTIRSTIRLAASFMLLGLLAPGAAAQDGTRLTVHGGLSITNRFREGGLETGPTLGLSVGRALGPWLGIEGTILTSVFGVSEAIPDCVPEVVEPCGGRIMAPGQLLSAALRVQFRPAARMTLLAGGGISRSLSFSAEDTSSDPSSVALLGGIRVGPFGARGHGPGFEFMVTRFVQDIGSVRWLMSPALVWSF